MRERHTVHSKTRAEQTFHFIDDPATVAQAVQSVLEGMGKVKSVVRETGTIIGKTSLSKAGVSAANVTAQITSFDGGTRLHVQTERGEGLATSAGAQKALGRFASAIGASGLQSSTNMGW